MARYRKIDVRIWIDQKFRQLSPLPPCGQALWFYLLTNPDTVNVPGLYRAGEAAMSEALGWPLKAFREAFAEASSEGLVRFDAEARVVWIPNAIKYNAPESPNVVKSWRVPWDEIPECKLKDQAYQVLKGFLEGLGKAFAEAFEKACRKPLPKGMANQEQEQEQEQETTPFIASKATGVELNGFPAWYDRYPRHIARRAAEIAYRAALKRGTAAELMAGLERQRAGFLAKDKDKVPYPATWLNGDRWKDEAEEPVNPYLDWPEMANCRTCGSCHDPKAWPKECAR